MKKVFVFLYKAGGHIVDVGVIVLMGGLCILMLCGLWIALTGIGSGRISVVVPNGRNSTTYNTDAIVKDGPGCIKFISSGDTVRVCDTYRIIKRGK